MITIYIQREKAAQAELDARLAKLSLSGLSHGDWKRSKNNLQRDLFDFGTGQQYHFICFFQDGTAKTDGAELEKNC